MNKLHEKLSTALAPFCGQEDCPENREKIVKVVLNILPTAGKIDAEILAVGLLNEVGIDEAKEKKKENT